LKKYTLIISEKPDAANRIAAALDANGKTMRETDNGVPFFAAKNGDKDIIVASALGHLYTVDGTKKGEWDYPVFDYEWVPVGWLKKAPPKSAPG
jgi:DNA topoisomerase I